MISLISLGFSESRRYIPFEDGYGMTYFRPKRSVEGVFLIKKRLSYIPPKMTSSL